MSTSAQAINYRDYMILYTEGERVDAVVDGAPPGPNGRLFTVEPGKAVKVPYEAGRFILDHMAYTGVVRVVETPNKDGSGTTFDINTAKRESQERFAEGDARRWQDYVTYCVADKLDQKRPVPPTPDAIKNIMARRGYKLGEYGITPMGEVKPMGDTSAIETLQAQNAVLMKAVADLNAKLSDALGEGQAK